jgi:hypothetical protein
MPNDPVGTSGGPVRYASSRELNDRLIEQRRDYELFQVGTNRETRIFEERIQDLERALKLALEREISENQRVQRLSNMAPQAPELEPENRIRVTIDYEDGINERSVIVLRGSDSAFLDFMRFYLERGPQAPSFQITVVRNPSSVNRGNTLPGRVEELIQRSSPLPDERMLRSIESGARRRIELDSEEVLAQPLSYIEPAYRGPVEAPREGNYRGGFDPKGYPGQPTEAAPMPTQDYSVASQPPVADTTRER